MFGRRSRHGSTVLLANPQQLEKYISLNELLNQSADFKLELGTTEKMWSEIQNRVNIRTVSLYQKRWWQYAAAAVVGVIVVVSFTIFYKQGQNGIKDNAVTQTAIDRTQLQTVRNTAAKQMLLRLEDGSEVTMEPEATLSYERPFATNNRNLELKGIAFFKVAKDTTKPFVVATSHINTTALGTSFRITAVSESNSVTVQLYTGKVKISRADDVSNSFANVFLVPGQQIRVNMTNYTNTVSAISNRPSVIPKSAKIQAIAQPIIFKQTALPQVFTILERIYKVNIVYNSQDVSKLTFTGKFSKYEDVLSILNNICILNGLTVEKTNSAYRIAK